MEWKIPWGGGHKRGTGRTYSQTSKFHKEYLAIPRDAYAIVWSMASLLLHEVQEYYGRDYIAKYDVYRLKNMTNFKEHGMIKRMYKQMLDLGGHFSVHEWANA